jgi:uncharacterized protein (TIGR02246 family)
MAKRSIMLVIDFGQSNQTRANMNTTSRTLPRSGMAAILTGICGFLVLAVLQLLGPSATAAQSATETAAARSADEAAIGKVVADFSDGWNRHDAHAMCASLSEDGDFISWRGEQFHTRQTYENEHVTLFAGLYSKSHRTDTVKKIWFLSPTLASVDDYFTMTGAKRRDGSDWPYREGYFNFVMRKQNGRWVVILSHAADFNAAPPRTGGT